MTVLKNGCRTQFGSLTEGAAVLATTRVIEVKHYIENYTSTAFKANLCSKELCVCVCAIDATVVAGTDTHPPMEQVTRLASQPGDLPSPLAKAAARYSA